MNNHMNNQVDNQVDNQIHQLLHQGMDKHAAGFYQEAEILYRKVLELVPEQPDAIHFIGVLAFNVGKFDIAKQYLNRALELQPDNAACYNNLGNVYQQEGSFKQSIAFYEKTLVLDDKNYKAYNNLGVAHIRLGDYEKANSCVKKALVLAPDYAAAHNNLGETYSNIGEYEKAFACYEKTIALEPDMPDAHWNRALSWLLHGELEKGFAEYEWRWKRPDTPKRDIDPSKRWDGAFLNGRSILIYEEQGIGDALQFVRYLPMVKKMGGRVIFEVSPALARLFCSLGSIDKLWVRNVRESTRDIDRFDFYCPILGLPHIFNTSLETIPSQTSYIDADKGMAASWKKRITQNNKLKVGIVWAGNPGHRNDHNRSCLLSCFKGLKRLQGVELYGMQKDKYQNWTDIEPLNIVQKDFGDDLHDFADTAALIENLDLVISVDTAIVHLAGAMGKKIWVLLPFFPDWRWMLERSDSPWYSGMKLFRQREPGGWEHVFNEIKDELTTVLKE